MGQTRKICAVLFATLLVFLVMICPCQTKDDFYDYNCNIDSLKNLPDNLPDTTRALNQVKIAFQYYQEGKYNEALEWVLKAERQAENLQYELGLIYAMNLKKYIYQHTGPVDSMFTALHETYELVSGSGLDRMESDVFFDLSLLELKIHNDPSYALDYIEELDSGADNLLDCNTIINRYYTLAYLFNQSKMFDHEWETAEKMYENLINCDLTASRYNGTFIVFYGYLGVFHHVHGNFKKAIDYYSNCLADMPCLQLIPSHAKDLQARIYNSISRTYLEWGKYDLAMEYERRAIAAHRQIGFVTGQYGGIIDLSNYLEGMGYIFLRQSNYDSALLYFERSKNIRIQVEDELGIAICDDGLGETYMMKGNYFLAMEHLDSALARKLRYDEYWTDYTRPRISESFRTRTIKTSIAQTRLLLGKLYRDWGKNELSIEYLRQSYEDALEAPDFYGQALAVKELGITYRRIPEIDSARYYLERSLDIANRMELPVMEGRIYYELGKIALSTGSEKEFLDLCEKANDIFLHLGLSTDHAQISMSLGLFWLGKGENRRAQELLIYALEIADQAGLKRISMECCQGLSQIYVQMDSLSLAWHYMNRYNLLNKEIFDLDVLKKINQVDAVYHLSKSEESLRQMELAREVQDMKMLQNRYFMFALTALIIIIVLFFMLIMRNSRIKAQQDVILLEHRLLRSQMNPHFIFNALTNIQDSIFKQDALKASKYLTYFSRLIRNILEGSREEYIDLQTDIDLIKDYLELQKLRHSNKFEFTIEIDPEIDPEMIQVPPMLTQPFIENAVEHGIRHKLG